MGHLSARDSMKGTLVEASFTGKPERCNLIQTCTPNGLLYTVTYTRCHIDTINSPDDGHMGARNMNRIEIHIHEKGIVLKGGYLQRLLSCM